MPAQNRQTSYHTSSEEETIALGRTLARGLLSKGMLGNADSQPLDHPGGVAGVAESTACSRAATVMGRSVVVLLIGKLGAGKTTLAKGIVHGLGAAPVEEVSSPTFTLIHEYGDPPKVYHIDLYRLEREEEVASLGLDEIFECGAVVLVEWGERFLRLMPSARIEVRLEHVEQDQRRIEVTEIEP